MDSIVNDDFVAFPPIPTASGVCVLWDSGSSAPTLANVTPGTMSDLSRKTHRVAGTLKADQAWTLLVQQLMSDGTTWTSINAGTAVLANATLDFNVYVAGGGRRRVVANMGGTPTVWLTSGTLRLIAQADFVA